MVNYTQKEVLEAYLDRSLTNNEIALLPMLLEAVDSYINEEIGGSFGIVDSSTRYYDGGGSYIDIDPVYVDNDHTLTIKYVDEDYADVEDIETNEYTYGPQSSPLKTFIRVRNGRFGRGEANIAVTGSFTLSPVVPKDIIYLATQLVAKFLSDEMKGEVSGLKSESIEGYSRTFRDFTTANEEYSFILNKYRKDEVLI
jgi:hypothetical protein